MTADRDTHLGLAATLSAFVIWGLAPLYFKLLATTGADEIIAHRVLWSVAFLGAVLLVRERNNFLSHLRIDTATLAALTVSGLLIAANWLIFVHAINTDRVLSTSLGYFINPLVSVLFGLLFFRETLNGWQALAVAIAGFGTLYMTVRIGQFPWIALSLAVTFALYSVVRKKLDVGPMVGLFWETLIISPLALVWLWWLSSAGVMQFGHAAPAVTLLLVGTGLITLVPLVLFAAGVRRLALSTVGLMQYLAPSMTFCLAVFLFNEPFTLDHAVTFGCVWAGLLLFSWAGWQRFRRARLPV